LFDPAQREQLAAEAQALLQAVDPARENVTAWALLPLFSDAG
jgi:hypothetical protein